MLGRIKNKPTLRNTVENLQNIMDKEKKIIKTTRRKRDYPQGRIANLATDLSSATIICLKIIKLICLKF